MRCYVADFDPLFSGDRSRKQCANNAQTMTGEFLRSIFDTAFHIAATIAIDAFASVENFADR